MVIDFHSHILPGIDDGSRGPEMSCKMLTKAATQKIDVMVATPHFYADQMRIEHFLEQRDAAYEKLMNCHFREEDIRILCGAEVTLFPGMGSATDIDRLCIKGTRLMMVEMPFRAWSKSDLREVKQLIHRGITPIIAHIERFLPLQRDKTYLEELMELPVYIQVNAEVFHDFWMRRRMVKLFQSGKAHLLGSDCHSLHRRPPNLDVGRSVLRQKLGQSALDEMDSLGAKLLKLEAEFGYVR